MAKCEFCGRSLADTAFDQCPVCYPLYMKDLETGHLPPHCIPECFLFSDWANVRILEQNMRRQGASDEAILEAVARYGTDRRQSYEAVKAEQEDTIDIEKAQRETLSQYSY